jgi:hypothetical protein
MEGSPGHGFKDAMERGIAAWAATKMGCPYCHNETRIGDMKNGLCVSCADSVTKAALVGGRRVEVYTITTSKIEGPHTRVEVYPHDDTLLPTSIHCRQLVDIEHATKAQLASIAEERSRTTAVAEAAAAVQEVTGSAAAAHVDTAIDFEGAAAAWRDNKHVSEHVHKVRVGPEQKPASLRERVGFRYKDPRLRVLPR